MRARRVTYLSLEMLQSMTVFLLVLTMMKGRWMMELGGGGLFACSSVCLFRCTRFLNAICCKTRWTTAEVKGSKCPPCVYSRCEAAAWNSTNPHLHPTTPAPIHTSIHPHLQDELLKLRLFLLDPLQPSLPLHLSTQAQVSIWAEMHL